MNYEQTLQSVEIAKMYYFQNKTQAEIARELCMSRSNVSRILTRSLENGLVEIKINDPMSEIPQVANRISKAFSLQEVIISQTSSDISRSLRNLGDHLATFLSSTLSSDMLLGVTGGKSLAYTARAFSNSFSLSVDVVQFHGNAYNMTNPANASNIVESFERKLHGRGYILNAPIMVQSSEAKKLLMLTPTISEIFEKYQNVDIALLDITMPQTNISPQLREPWLLPADAIQLQELQATSCVCGHYFDINGHSCNAGVFDRTMAVDMDTLMKVPIRIGVACDSSLLTSTIGALNSGLINILFVDESLALDIQEYCHSRQKNCDPVRSK